MNAINAKHWYASKTLWTQIIAVVALALQLKFGFVISPEYQVIILAIVNAGLRLMTKEGVVLWLAVLMLTGCSIGYSMPGWVRCKGKGVVTFSGGAGGGVIYGAGGSHSGTAVLDCGDGLEFSQGSGVPPEFTSAGAPAVTPAVKP